MYDSYPNPFNYNPCPNSGQLVSRHAAWTCAFCKQRTPTRREWLPRVAMIRCVLLCSSKAPMLQRCEAMLWLCTPLLRQCRQILHGWQWDLIYWVCFHTGRVPVGGLWFEWGVQFGRRRVWWGSGGQGVEPRQLCGDGGRGGGLNFGA